jgi:hypothetical protein
MRLKLLFQERIDVNRDRLRVKESGISKLRRMRMRKIKPKTRTSTKRLGMRNGKREDAE